MRIRFDGKTVVVSGAGHGFGRCIAEIFAQLGAHVFGCDLSAAELAETARAGVDTEVLDLTDRAAAAAWIVEIERATGGAVDVLVNNAGGVAGQEMRPIEEVPDADWDRIFAVNINTAFTLSRAVAAGNGGARGRAGYRPDVARHQHAGHGRRAHPARRLREEQAPVKAIIVSAHGHMANLRTR